MKNTMDESAFHKTDMPDWSRRARDEVKSFQASRVISGWNNSVQIPSNNKCDRKSTQIHIHDETRYNRSFFNHRAEVLPKAPEAETDAFGKVIKHKRDGYFSRTAELPVHPDLEKDNKRFNLSTEKFRKKQLDNMLNTFTSMSLEASHKYSAKLLERTGYTDLWTRTVESLKSPKSDAELLRQAADAEAKAIDNANKSWRGGFGSSSAVTASRDRSGVVPSVSVLLNGTNSSIRSSASNRLRSGMSTSLSAGPSLSRSRTDPSNGQSIVYQHEGTFNLLPANSVMKEGHEAYAWSCCGSTDKDSRGCGQIIKKTSYQFDSFC